ncbi:hypothetical protein Nepgr_011506 [Nepenthes gracilis]|uniref:DUF309 domain-containing protein n=1 Tax=Nepenthes gracilis TaxID=150966 RepID=A0AAD3SE64_NEPGR|nr:hypothetical protein Nepgr_011506 [Nepenthes gracilis]
MGTLSLPPALVPSGFSSHAQLAPRLKIHPSISSSYPNKFHYNSQRQLRRYYRSFTTGISRSSDFSSDDEDIDKQEESSSSSRKFEEAVELFNRKEYYACHDLLEALWYNSHDPARTLLHAILQCAVGFHHLFNQNHKGAMMELGEGLCKLRKLNSEEGPFYQFEQEISAVLDFIYQTQLELAACGDDFCLAMDQTERSYLLLGGFAAGQHLYSLENDDNHVEYIVFHHERLYGTTRVKLPTLHATEIHLREFEYC